MKKRIISIISVTAILFAGLAVTDTQPQANAQQRPPGGDSIPAPQPSVDPGPDYSVLVQYNGSMMDQCIAICQKCFRKYQAPGIYGSCTDAIGRCKCGSTHFRPKYLNR